MLDDNWVYLEHMLDMSMRAVRALEGKSREEYDRDDVLVMGLAHFIQVIGEAARKISPDFQSAYPQIPWREIIGTRHRIVHDYMNVDEDVVWEIATHDLPALIAALENIIKKQ